MSKKFQNRVDYINMGAYSTGKVQIDDMNECKEEHSDNEMGIKHKKIIQLNEKGIEQVVVCDESEYRLQKKLLKVEKLVNHLQYSLCTMSERQDDRIDMIFGKTEPDEVQRDVFNAIYP